MMAYPKHAFRILGAVVLLAALVSPRAASAGPLLPGAAGGVWEYTFCGGSGAPTAGWQTSVGSGGDSFGCSWSTGFAPFGNTTFGSGPNNDFIYNTLWEAEPFTVNPQADDLFIRRIVDFSGYDLASLLWGLGVDNGYKLYLNGVLISENNEEGFAQRNPWEYTGGFGQVALSGLNYLALALEDHGESTAFDMEITGREIQQTAVPEPSTIALLGLGSAVLLASRKRLF